MRPNRRTVALVVVAAVVFGGVAWVLVVDGGGSPTPPSSNAGPRPVTAVEADRLAVMRFRIHTAGGMHFRTEVSSPQGPLVLEGDVDYRTGLGYGQVSGAGSAFVLQWDGRTLLAWAAPPASTHRRGQLPDGKPAGRVLAPTQSAVDAVLTLVLELGQDRPDNAQLIRQNGATWLRRDTVRSTEVDVIRGPAASPAAGTGGPVTYWLDAAGQVLRVDAHLGGGSSATVIDIDTASFVPFPHSGDLPA